MSNWLENVCEKKPHNCLRGHSCGPNSECCYERDTPSGKKGKQGTCVARGSCNYTTGIPSKSTEIKCPPKYYSEGYNSSGDGCECTNWKWALILMSFIAVVLALGFIVIGIKHRNMYN